MSIKEISSLLDNAKRPIDVFGLGTKEEINQVYRKLAKICYPDLVPEEYKELASEVSKQLNEMKEKADKELEESIYNITDKKELYKKKKPIIEFEIEGIAYKFYEHLRSEEIGEIYGGLAEDKKVCLKICNNEDDNELIENEYKALRDLDHPSMPKPIDILKINGKSSIIFESFEGLTTKEIKKEYGNIPGEHIAWILERMLCAVGYLHSNKIIHGNIKPENILINTEIHNVMLLDYSLCITDANEESSRYKIVNDDYTPSYVDSSARPYPNADIFAIGKAAIYMLGGDIKTNGMPMNCDSKMRDFIRKLINLRENDAWELWDELREIRNDVYGTERFKKLERKL